MKYCNKCKEIKPLTEFYKNKRTKDRLQAYCKKCSNKQTKKWRENNPERQKETSKEYYKNNLEYFKKQFKEYYKNNPEYFKEQSKKWYKNNSEKIRERQKKCYKNNPEKYKKRTRNQSYNKEYWAKKRAIPQNKVNASFRERIRKSINNKKAGRKWESLVGYTLKDLMEHLESNFEP